ncbi:MAG TPA: hypothetical protein VNJ04_08190 [Gemmatimonadaceae bacterium]|nr:hypothetical protein [Gemmatimonadaceae bacterium]
MTHQADSLLEPSPFSRDWHQPVLGLMYGQFPLIRRVFVDNWRCAWFILWHNRGLCYTEPMVDTTYRTAFEQAKKDLAGAMERRTAAAQVLKEANEEIVQLRRAVTALAVLCSEDVEDSMGLTEAVRTVAPIGKWWTSKTFAQQVEAIGVSLSDLKNPEASMLSVLNRLSAAKELEATTGKGPDGSVKLWRKNNPDDDIPF